MGARGAPAAAVRALFMCVCWFVRRLLSVHVHAWMPILSTSTHGFRYCRPNRSSKS